MSVSLAQARPPYVEFKRIAIEDKKRSLEMGYRVTKDVEMVYVMQPGSKDQVERLASDWLASIKLKALNGSPDAFPQEWIDGFHRKYQAWKDGNEMPLNGTSVKEWPVLSPSQAENFISLRVLTIEDVAGMTEECMARYGMGGRELRDRAREWIKGKEISAQIAQENIELKQKMAALEERLAAMESPVIGNDLEKLRAEYETKFGKKPHHKMSIASLTEALKEQPAAA